MLFDKRRGGGQNRITHLAPVRLDCLGPELGHTESILSDE